MSATASTSRTSLVDPENTEVAVARQLELLHIPRSSYYYKPRRRRRALEGDDRELAMRVVDEARLEMPYAGARKPRVELRGRTNKAIRFPNQAWGIDITYVPIGRSHMYLTCVIDWYSRYVVGWRLASDMGAAGVCECVSRAFDERGAPSILNSGQGSVFSSAEYEALLGGRHVLQSMDGKARRVDNVIVERWFRSLKSECLRANEYETPAELRRLVAGYVEQYNNARLHQSPGYDTPAEWYHSGLLAA